MRKYILISSIFAVILLSLSGCMGMHHMSHENQGMVNHETANHGTNNHSGGCH
jgi:hypothetical protein